MKKPPVAHILLLFLSLFAVPPARSMSLEQLEKGAAVMVVHSAKAASTQAQANEGLLFMGYYWGYFQSIQSGAYRDKETSEKRDRYVPAEFMWDVSKGAASIANFVARLSGVNKDRKAIAAGPVITAWFLCNCKNADAKSKFLALEILRKEFGENFEGESDFRRDFAGEMTKEAIFQEREGKGLEGATDAVPKK